jgi:hypothetical protein
MSTPHKKPIHVDSTPFCFVSKWYNLITFIVILIDSFFLLSFLLNILNYSATSPKPTRDSKLFLPQTPQCQPVSSTKSQ